MELTSLKGIGEKTAAGFEKLGVHDQKDLLEFFPRGHELFFEPETIGEIGYKTFATVRGVFAEPLFMRRVKKLSIVTGTLRDEAGGTIKVTWFNAPYIRDQIKTGQLYILKGRVSHKYNTSGLVQPKIYTPEAYEELKGKMLPVYNTVKGLSNNQITTAVKQAMAGEAFELLDREDILPEVLKERLYLIDKSRAVKNMHFPESRQLLSEAAYRLSFEEIFLFILAMKKNSDKLLSDTDIVIPQSPDTDAFIDSLPFELTGAQKKVIAQIREDLCSRHAANRLIQGDVGSGKTMVALAALMDCAYAGYQGALMAPTEVLARQHYDNFTSMFKAAGIKLNVVLLTGSMTALEKKVVYDALEDGRADIVIGTHALFQEKVKYRNLGVVITDEQHRFGIRQRQALAQKAGGKGSIPHTFVMSATPIPRTLALILYGNMDVSVLDEMPVGRLPIKNAVVDESYRKNAYSFMEKQIRNGRQIYVICPLIEYSEGMEAANVTDHAEMLKDVMDDKVKIDILHGQMSAEKKNEVMERFASGKTDILVSTTVVEVGVDVPNATVMMIEDADRFGLATLHQLRGRVGRGKEQSYCIFVCSSHSKEARERLEILLNSNDGFEIASKDLSMRGPGEFGGTRQSGALSFRNFDIQRDIHIAEKAQEAVEEYLSGGMELSERERAALEGAASAAAGSILL